MALQRQMVPVSFVQGQDTKTDPKQVQLGKLLLLENATLVSPMQLKKANGFASLSRRILGDLVNKIEEAEGLSVLNNELLLASDSQLYSFSAANQAWAPKGTLLSTVVTQESIDRGPTGDLSADSAIHPSGLRVFAWVTPAGVRYSVFDSNTGQLVVSEGVAEVSPADVGQAPKCLSTGNFLFVLFLDSTGGTLAALPIFVGNPQNPSALITLSSSVNTTHPTYDACVGPINEKIYFAANDSTSPNIRVGFISPSLIPGSALIATTASAAGGIGLLPTTDRSPGGNKTIMVAYATAAAVRAFTIDTVLSQVMANTLVETVGGIGNVTGLWDDVQARLYYTVATSPAWENKIRANTLTVGAVAGTPRDVVLSLSLAGKPFTNLGVDYVLGNYESASPGIQNTYFLVDQDGIAVAKILGNAAGGYRDDHLLAEANTPVEDPAQLVASSTQFQYACLIQSRLTTNVSIASASLPDQNDLFSLFGVESVTVDMFDPAVSYAKAVLADTLHITGGFLQMYDGSTVVEHGFHLWPEKLSASSAGGSGKTYQYVGVYEWTDAQGNIHQSAPSVPYTLSNVGAPDSDNVTVAFPTLRVTAKSNVVLVVYRTEDAGTEFFRVSAVDTPTLNNKLVNTVNFVDNVSDANLLKGQPLYTFGGVVENVAPPAALAVNTFANRLWVLPAPTPLSLWYSKQVVPGTPAQFSDLFVLNVDPRGGPVTAMAAMDANQIIFKESLIFAVSGDGPDDTGQQNTFSGATLVATDSGCVDPRSVVLTPMGLMYKSAKGIYLLDRSLQAKYIGADVAAYNSQTITSATLVPTQNQVRYNLGDATQLVYDYYMQAWSVRPLLSAVDATVLDDQYFYAEATGRVLAETPGVYSIAGEGYSLKVGTSWLTAAGVSGLQRVYGMMLLGTWKSPHKLRITVYYDYNDDAFDTYDIDAEPFDPGFWGDGDTWGSDDVWGGNYPTYQFRVNFTRQKCTAVRVVIQDLQVPGLVDVDGNAAQPGEAYALSNLTFQVGIKSGWRKVGAERVFPVTTP